jgi:hypothetical protein
MSGQFVALTDVVLSGEEVDVSVQFKAPSEAGTYTSAWLMRNPAGITFEEIIFVKIQVQ